MDSEKLINTFKRLFRKYLLSQNVQARNELFVWQIQKPDRGTSGWGVSFSFGHLFDHRNQLLVFVFPDGEQLKAFANDPLELVDTAAHKSFSG